ncbi:hypothetical protein, partial [Paracoccus marinaquae]
RVAPLGDLRDRVPFELIAELAAAHYGLLASKLAKKASTIHGAIHRNFRTGGEESHHCGENPRRSDPCRHR